jgi:hypothetical protein
MSNGSEACCALGICCPPEQRRAALIKILVEDGVYAESAEKAADAVLTRFALAPLAFHNVINDIMAHWHAHGKDQG